MRLPQRAIGSEHAESDSATVSTSDPEVRSLLVLLLFGSPAIADVGVSVFGQAGRYADQPQSALGLAVELSIDRPRWVYFTEVAAGVLSFGEGTMHDDLAGALVRGAVGVRHVVRRFDVPRAVGFELGFEALVGVQDLEWRDAERDLRPELAVGFAWTFHLLPWKVASRWSVRAYFAPAPDDVMTETITPGYMFMMGVTW